MNKSNWLDTAVPPLKAQPTASAFAEWVFYQSALRIEYLRPEPDSIRQLKLRLGKISHDDIDLFMRTKWAVENIRENQSADWKVEFVDSSREPSRIFEASRLRVIGEAIRCVPDVVLRNSTTTEVVIIERKTTHVPEPRIPDDGWPNVEAQLWCYSWIDNWIHASDIILVGQLWRRDRGGLVLCHRHPIWRRSDAAHQFRCLAWFEKYGGCLTPDGFIRNE